MMQLERSAVAVVLGLALFGTARAEGMTKAEHKAGEDRIDAEYTAAKNGCGTYAGNAKDVCVAEAKGKANVAKAELLASYEPTAKHAKDVRVARAEAAYAIASERCDDKAGNDKDVCVKEAKAARTHALADADTRLTTTEANAEANEKSAAAGAKAAETKFEARKDAATDNRAADYAVAKEKCDALAGEAKDRCVSDAKVTFGQH